MNTLLILTNERERVLHGHVSANRRALSKGIAALSAASTIVIHDLTSFITMKKHL